MQVLFAILLAALGIAQAQMSFPDITQAAAAIDRVFRTIDRKTQIDSGSEAGQGPPKPYPNWLNMCWPDGTCVSAAIIQEGASARETDMRRLPQQVTGPDYLWDSKEVLCSRRVH